jgi:hypothetical protein
VTRREVKQGVKLAGLGEMLADFLFFFFEQCSLLERRNENPRQMFDISIEMNCDELDSVDPSQGPLCFRSDESLC